jgi:hypothetical protein
MAHTDFTLETVDTLLGVKAQPADLFAGLAAVPVPAWLADALARGPRQALLSEKARSEFLVAPILLAAQELSPRAVAIYSGTRLDVDAKQGLVGECAFILSATPPLPALLAPILIVLGAKKNDIESGIGQCMAQMVGARLFNERTGKSCPELFGGVTTGEVWQFLRLEGMVIGIDRRRLDINEVGEILAALQAIVARPIAVAPQGAPAA